MIFMLIHIVDIMCSVRCVKDTRVPDLDGHCIFLIPMKFRHCSIETVNALGKFHILSILYDTASLCR